MRAELTQTRSTVDTFAAHHQRLAELGFDPAQESDRQRLEATLAALEGLGAESGDLTERLREISEMQAELGDLRQVLGYYRRGFGDPPCWHDGEWRIDYTFDVKVTSGGFVLRAVQQPPRHAAHPAMAAVDAVTTGREVPPSTFVAETRPIYDWSAANDCRFFVTVYDGTADHEKRIFQERMQILERHFYKRERLHVEPPF